MLLFRLDRHVKRLSESAKFLGYAIAPEKIYDTIVEFVRRKVTISSWTRQSDASFPLRGKISGAYITSALAKNEAVNRGFDDAILMNKDGKVCE